jgi:membrane protein YqaA with SNARE-associated domain
MKLLLAIFALSFVSALFPLVNAEALMAWVATQDGATLAVAAALAATGQVLGKLLWYYGGMRTVDSGWVQRKLAKHHNEERLDRWRTTTQDRPMAAGGLVFASAFVGLPPFLAVAAVAGLLGVGVWLFVVTGLVGRFLRFWLVLELASWSWLFVH